MYVQGILQGVWCNNIGSLQGNGWLGVGSYISFISNSFPRTSINYNWYGDIAHFSILSSAITNADDARQLMHAQMYVNMHESLKGHVWAFWSGSFESDITGNGFDDGTIEWHDEVNGRHLNMLGPHLKPLEAPAFVNERDHRGSGVRHAPSNDFWGGSLATMKNARPVSRISRLRHPRYEGGRCQIFSSGTEASSPKTWFPTTTYTVVFWVRPQHWSSNFGYPLHLRSSTNLFEFAAYQQGTTTSESD